MPVGYCALRGLATALAHTACMKGHSALFTTAINIINSLAASQASGGIKREMNKYLKPQLLVIDELGYLPIDKFGADCLFQIISARYQRINGVRINGVGYTLNAIG